ncbi:hypothetical protein M0Q28_01160 [Patescibacteria group bacterium]|nr:hypothetical protein [Patescibacteria group bacterium]
MNQDKTGLWLAIGLLGLTVIVLGAYVLFGGTMRGPSYVERPMPVEPDGGPGGVVCTMEAKQCPDGSYVGRTGPRCEFAPCPTGAKVEINY